MRSLLIRIFISFWLIIMITIVAAAAIGYTYAERARSAMQNFEVSEAMLAASTALRENGHEGLTEWLDSLPGVTSSRVYVLDNKGDDLLGRALPAPIGLAMRRFGAPRFRQPPPMREFGNLRPARPFTQLVGPDDRVYTFFVLPPQGVVGRWLSERGGLFIACLALLVSTAISYLLARAISRPIQRFRESAVAIAGGNLDTRVADRVGKRRDEIGLLARDFDQMAIELQRSWQRQTELTRNVSHELRSPLARLRVALELARRKAGDLAEFEKIDEETERLDDLIGQILEFSRLDADPQEPRVDIDLDELLASVAEDVRYEYGRTADETSIRIDFVTDCVVSGYPGALRSAITNILRNAMQHTRAGTQVQVNLQSDATRAVIIVEDNGGGVSDHELDGIFEPFYRATGGSTRSSEGTGLGLAIASRAVAMHGGSIAARNTAHGLAIEIRLPAMS